MSALDPRKCKETPVHNGDTLRQQHKNAKEFIAKAWNQQLRLESTFVFEHMMIMVARLRAGSIKERSPSTPDFLPEQARQRTVGLDRRASLRRHWGQRLGDHQLEHQQG